MPEQLTVTEDQVRALRDVLDALLPDERIAQLTEERDELRRTVDYFDAQSKRRRDQRDRARRTVAELEKQVAELTRRLAEIPRTEQCGSGGFHGPHQWSVVAVWCPGRTEQATQ
ncbi:hypothetical protein ACFY7B_21155 [Streptomyces albidoflavus]